jgi:DNA-binding NtrC family response regulator
VKLLTALQDGRLERLGGTEPVEVDVRVVAATNRDLVREVDEGRFRLDLYHRLRVLEIALPPLRSRPEDVEVIVRATLPALASRVGVEPPELSPSFLRALAVRRWPGNVRELLHEVERSLVRCRGPVLEATVLGDDVLRVASPREAVTPMARDPADPAAEISRVLRSTGGNVSRAARRLGVSRGTLRYRIVQHGLGSLIPRD